MNCLRKICAFLLLCASMSTMAYAQIHISGPQSGVLIDTTYIVDSAISIQTGDSLAIMPGATLLFNNTAFFIDGYLYAVGTEQDSIQFLPLVASSYWTGLSIQNGAAGSQISYCVIQRSANNGITLTSARDISITHSSIRQCGSGGIRTNNIKNLLVSDCDIVRNRSFMDHAAGLHLESSRDTHIINCRILENTCYESDAWGGAIWATNVSKVTLTNCLIRGNKKAGSMYGAAVGIGPNALGYFSNCTIVENGPTLNNLNTNSLYLFDPTVVTNCIIRNNVSYEIHATGSESAITYSDVHGGYTGTGNFDADPLFVTGPGGAYYLSQVAAGQPVNSPCVDAGAPAWPMVTGTTRTDGVQDAGIVDIGYHYPVAGRGLNEVGDAHSVVSLSGSGATPTIGVSPNPFNPTTAISYQLQATSQIELTVWDTAGRLVATLVDGMEEAGQHSVTFDGSKLASGLYFARIQAGEHTAIQKLMLVK